jgi:hypothetical protein
MALWGKSIRLTLLLISTLILSSCEGVGNSVSNLKTSFGEIITASSSIFQNDGNTQENTPKVASEKILAADESCPKVTIVNELNSIHRFKDMKEPTKNGNISNISISDVISGCRYNEENIVVEMNIEFEGNTGAKARISENDTPSFSYPYFVALTSPQGDILAKEVYAITLSYDLDTDKVVEENQVRHVIPLNGDIYGPDHTLLLGFQLSQQELAYNRGQITADDGLDKAFAMSISPEDIEPASGDEGAKIPDLQIPDEIQNFEQNSLEPIDITADGFNTEN